MWGNKNSYMQGRESRYQLSCFERWRYEEKHAEEHLHSIKFGGVIDHWCQIVLSYGTMDVARTHLESFWPITFVVSSDYPLESGLNTTHHIFLVLGILYLLIPDEWFQNHSYHLRNVEITLFKCPRDVQPHAYHMNAEALFVPIALKICLNFLVILRIDPDPDLFLTLSLLDGSALSIEEQEIFSQK